MARTWLRYSRRDPHWNALSDPTQSSSVKMRVCFRAEDAWLIVLIHWEPHIIHHTHIQTTNFSFSAFYSPLPSRSISLAVSEVQYVDLSDLFSLYCTHSQRCPLTTPSYSCSAKCVCMCVHVFVVELFCFFSCTHCCYLLQICMAWKGTECMLYAARGMTQWLWAIISMLSDEC